MPRIVIPWFQPDSRGNRLEDWEIRRKGAGCLVYLKCADAVAKQVRWAFTDHLVTTRGLNATEDSRWTHLLEMETCPGDELTALLGLLQKVLTLEVTSVINLGIALDFYKDPQVDQDGNTVGFLDTPAGSLVNRLKHRQDMAALGPLAGALAQVVREHPICGKADTVASIPGRGQNWSYGEILAEKVAELAGRPFIRIRGRSATRLEAKSRDPNLDLTNEFIPPPEARGHVVLLVDDVYMTGGSARAGAAVLREAGAVGVMILVGARTLRN